MRIKGGEERKTINIKPTGRPTLFVWGGGDSAGG